MEKTGDKNKDESKESEGGEKRKAGYHLIREGLVTAQVPIAEKVSREMEVFYNPVMQCNRDVSVLVLKALWKLGKAPRKGWTIASPMAGSGVRECRFLSELPAGAVAQLSANDLSPRAVALIKKNLSLNKKRFTCRAVTVTCTEANHFLLGAGGFSYIDIDPFGTPNPFLDAACKRLHRYGVLGVTATDTSALAGTYPNACRRKYWATPMRNHLMHEVGLRILARKVQLIGAQYEKALIPIYSYAKDHYMRIFFLCKPGKAAVDDVLAQHAFLHFNQRTLSTRAATSNRGAADVLVAGPLWTGALWDPALARVLAEVNAEENDDARLQKFLDTLAAEATAPVLGFYPFNLVRQVLKRAPLKKRELLKRTGVWPTHLEGNAVRASRRSLLF
ncbi:hypothetical protein D6789_04430 [Candidatus Woesearchaeota archaeon]|nr:MAG: hypothetical protein D6789_04430 [Candidatus Woesearchaeota archaeon]